MVGRIASIALIAAAAGCAGSGTDADWLVIVSGDTVTVSEAGAHWDSLAPGDRAVFDGSLDLASDYLNAYSRMFLIRCELQRLGYPGRPCFEVQRTAVARIRMMNALQDSILAASTRALTEEDISFFLANMDRTVTFTLTGPSGEQICGPALLPELPEEMASTLLLLEPGETSELSDGRSIRIESIVFADPDSISAFLEDSAGARSMAVYRLSRSRASEEFDRLLSARWSSAGMEFDPPAMSRLSAFFRGEEELCADDTLMTGATGTWTSRRMVDEIDYESTMRLVEPSDSNWIASYAKVLVNRCNLAGEFMGRYPSAADLLLAAAADFALESAAESLFTDFVLDSITVTEAQVDSAYLASPPTIEEKRSVQALVIPPERLAEFEEAVSNSTILQIAGTFDGFFSAGPSGGTIQTSPPCTVNQIPMGMGESVFALGDTLTWTEPVPLGSDHGQDLLVMRVLEIHPSRVASPEEASLRLSGEVRSALIEDRLEEWLGQLGDSFGLVINEELLESLPDDPGAWSDI